MLNCQQHKWAHVAVIAVPNNWLFSKDNEAIVTGFRVGTPFKGPHIVENI